MDDTVPMVCREARFGLKELRFARPAGIAKRVRWDMRWDIPWGGVGLTGVVESLAPPSDEPTKAGRLPANLRLCHFTRNKRRTNINPNPAMPPKTPAITVEVGGVTVSLLEPPAPEVALEVAALEAAVPVAPTPPVKAPLPEPVAP